MSCRSSLGRARLAATNLGISLEDYQSKRAAGLKHCTTCKDWLPEASFAKDRSRGDGIAARCLACGRTFSSYVPVAPDQRKPRGKPKSQGRDGDKALARLRVSKAIGRGLIAHASTVPCADCGHIGPDRKHEHDHYLGYAAEHHLDVQVVCVPCHKAREVRRGVFQRQGVAAGESQPEPRAPIDDATPVDLSTLEEVQ